MVKYPSDWELAIFAAWLIALCVLVAGALVF